MNHFNYVVTAFQPSCVYQTISGSFVGPNEVNVMVAHGTRFVMSRLGTDGLESIVAVPVYGRIASLHTIRLPNSNTDSIFFLTERYQMCIISWNAATVGLICFVISQHLCICHVLTFRSLISSCFSFIAISLVLYRHLLIVNG